MKDFFYKYKSNFYLIIYLFIFLFLPPVIKKVNILIPLFIYSFLIIIIKYRKEFINYFKTKKDCKYIKFLLIYFFVYILSILINGLVLGDFYSYNYFISLYSILLVFICIPICSLYLVLYCKKRNISFDVLIKSIIFASLIEALITLLCLLSSSIKEFFVEIMKNNTEEILFYNKYHLERRFFGFSNNMFDTYGFGTGLISLLPLYYSVRESKKWLFAVPFLILIPLLNSRTGLVVFSIGLFFFMIYIIKEKKLREYVLSFLYAILIGISGYLIVFFSNKATIDWIITDLKSFFDGNVTGTATVLFSDNSWKLPSGIHLLFGNGITVAGYGGLKDTIGFSSDVGYINELWRSGLIGLSLLMFSLCLYIKEFLKNIRSDYKYFVLSIIPILLISHIKFHILCCNPGSTLLILISIFVAANGKYVKKKFKGNDLISVIVPIYNVEDYLEKCISSITNQSYRNIEILLINDGSPDNSDKICKKYAKLDKRIRYIEQENKGLSGARNTGIDKANGKYLIFVDSDDYINKFFVEKLYDAIISTKVSMAFCRYKYVYNSNYDIDEYEYGSIKCFSNEKKYNLLYNYLKDYCVVSWNKIYHRDIFKKLRFPQGKIHEDQYVICDVLDNCNSVAILNEELYYYLQRNDSITGNYKINRLDILDSLKNKIQFFKDKKMKKHHDNALYDYCLQLIIQRNNVKSYFPEKKDIIDNINKELKKHVSSVYKSIYVNPLKKVKLLLKLKNVKE